MSDSKSETNFGEGLTAPSAEDRHSDFSDRADALLRWKQPDALISETGKLADTTDDLVAPGGESEKTAASKLSEMEKHTSKCGDCGMKKCACASKTAMLKEAISTKKLRRAGFWAGLKDVKGTRVPKARSKAQGRVGAVLNKDWKAGTTNTEKSRARFGDAVDSEVALGMGMRKGRKVRKAAIYGAGAAAAVGGGTALALKKKKEKTKTAEGEKKRSGARKALTVAGTIGGAYGGAGAVAGGLGAGKGNRLKGALAGGVTGAAGGVTAGGIAKGLSKFKTANDEQAREALVERLPAKGLPSLAIDQHIDDLKHSLLGKVEDYKDIRTQLTTGAKEKKVRLARPPKELMGKLKEAGIKDMLKQLSDPAALASMGIGAAAGGTGMYLASRPKKSLGGKSSAERDLETLVSAQKARGEEGASFPRRMKNRYVEFSKGLATDFRKSPGAATAMGAISGATAGALAARMLGAGK